MVGYEKLYPLMNSTHWISYFIAGAVLLAACGTGPAPEDPAPQVLFGPSAMDIPFPNSAWLDPDTGTLHHSTDGASPAYASLIDSYLNTLPAFPPNTGIMFRINAPRDSLDEESIRENTHLVDLTDEVIPITDVAWALEDEPGGFTRVIGSRSSKWSLGHRYALIVATGLKTTTGEPLEVSPSFRQIRGGQIEGLGMDPSLVEQITATIEPVFQRLASESVPGLPSQRTDILLLSAFDIQTGPVVDQDLIRQVRAYPDDEWMDQSSPNPDVQYDAQKQLDTFLRSQDGFSVTSRIFVPIEGLTDISQSPDIKLWDLGPIESMDSITPILVPHSQDLHAPGLVITPWTPNQTLDSGHRYYCTVQRPTSDSVYHPPLHFALLQTPEELISEGRSTIPFLTLEQAEALQVVKDSFYLEENLVDEDTLLAWSWTTVSDVEALYHPEKQLIPVPNDRETIGPKAFGVPAGLPEESQQLVQSLLDGVIQTGGFPPNTTIQIPMSGVLDTSDIQIVEEAHNPMNVAQGHILLLDVTDIDAPTDLMLLNDRPPLTNFSISADSSGRLTLAPTQGGWPVNRRILVVLLKTLPTSSDGTLLPTPDFFLSALEHPLVDPENGLSLVHPLSDTEANTLETRRLENVFYSSLLSVATNGILNIEDVALFWTFQTREQPMEDLDELYLHMLLDNVDSSLKSGAFKNIQNHSPPEELSGYNLNEIGHVMLNGRFESRAMIQPEDILLDEDGNVTSFPEFEFADDGTPIWSPNDVPFVVALPGGMPPQEGWPILIYQHDLGMNAMSLFQFAHKYTEQDIAVVAMDTYLHGQRALESKADGEHYFDGSILALRDHLRQSTLDLMAFSLFLRNGLAPFVKTYLYQQGTLHVGYQGLNIGKVYFHGYGLGGLFGIPFLGLDSFVSRCALSMVGAPLIQLMTESDDPQMHSLIAGFTEFSRENPAYNLSPIYDLLQWGLAPAEPIQYAPLVLDIMNTAPNNRKVFLQLAEQDTAVSYDSSMSLWTKLKGGSAPERYDLKVYPDTCHQFLTAGCNTGVNDPASIPLTRQEAWQDLLHFYQSGQFP
ncbi:MAG: hypothetical protein CMH54_03570 [Myxococcales bacterium]|nr:hypothetical protein [Myxococcales bacterium]